MQYQTLLIVILAILVVILSILLVIRIRREKQQSSAIRRMDLEDFSEFLRTNSIEGTIQTVAGRVSEFLKGTFGCEKIVFLRKQRGLLELNYYHGIRGFKRHEFRVRYSDALGSRLQDTFMPRRLDSLADLLPEPFVKKLEQLQIDTYFPVYWRSNLYGLYFVKSSLALDSPSFTVLIGGLAQSLAAAYHIKWHEARYQKLEQKIKVEPVVSPVPIERPGKGGSILKLVKHRNSESIVPRIIETMQRELEFSQVLFFYEPRDKDGALMFWRDGVQGTVDLPERGEFSRLCQELTSSGPCTIADLGRRGKRLPLWLEQAQAAGIAYVSCFPITSRRMGLLGWSGGRQPRQIANRLQTFHANACDLVENAESYERVEEMSYTDNLTGLANQRYFRKRLSEEISRAKRYQRSLALIIFDLDDLKTINDNYGHLAGDAVLKRLGQILRSSIRAIDIIARYGGDEFCVIMPEADGATCERFMNRLQLKISSSKFGIDASEGDLRCTISQGGAVFPDSASGEKELMHAADMALLQAKESGRNAYLLYDRENWPKTV